MRKYRDLTNKIFGRLIALRPTSLHKHGCVVWECQCLCGANVAVSADSLLRSNTKSCGCLRKETSSVNGRRAAQPNGKYVRYVRNANTRGMQSSYSTRHIKSVLKRLGL